MEILRAYVLIWSWLVGQGLLVWDPSSVLVCIPHLTVLGFSLFLPHPTLVFPDGDGALFRELCCLAAPSALATAVDSLKLSHLSLYYGAHPLSTVLTPSNRTFTVLNYILYSRKHGQCFGILKCTEGGGDLKVGQWKGVTQTFSVWSTVLPSLSTKAAHTQIWCLSGVPSRIPDRKWDTSPSSFQELQPSRGLSLLLQAFTAGRQEQDPLTSQYNEISNIHIHVLSWKSSLSSSLH